MNLRLEVYLDLPEEEWSPEGISALAVRLSDLVTDAGHGNVAAPEGEETVVRSVVVIRPCSEEPDGDEWWDEIADGAMAISMPTKDERFLKLAEEGGLPGS